MTRFRAKAQTEKNAGSSSRLAQISSVLLVDRPSVVRHAISAMLNNLDGLSVTAEVASFAEAMAVLSEERFDLMVTEIDLDGRSGVDLLHEIRRMNLTNVKTFVLTHLDSPEFASRAMLAGARGFARKQDTYSDIVVGLQKVLAGERWVPADILDSIEQSQKNYDLTVEVSAEDPLGLLSSREREIFHLLASGLQNAVIAKKLFISPRTVETHRARIVRKLNLSSNGELIRYAIKHGLSVP